jgi:hypothetical protein
MSTLRELTAESIGRITRRGLEPQIALVEASLAPKELVRAVAPGQHGSAGQLVVISDRRLLIAVGEPFARPELSAVALDDVRAAEAASVGELWQLRIHHLGGEAIVDGMFDRDARRLATVLSAEA